MLEHANAALDVMEEAKVRARKVRALIELELLNEADKELELLKKTEEKEAEEEAREKEGEEEKAGDEEKIEKKMKQSEKLLLLLAKAKKSYALRSAKMEREMAKGLWI